MVRMSSLKRHRRYFGDRSQLKNYILESGVTCHMILDISDFVPDHW